MDEKLKHLEFIQSVISRMATNEFLFKGWAITIAAGLSAFAAADTKRALLIIALASTALFWGLDGYYLWLERCFIALYRQVAANTGSIDFSMVIDKRHAFSEWLKTCWRPHLFMFYLTIIVVDFAGIFLVKAHTP